MRTFRTRNPGLLAAIAGTTFGLLPLCASADVIDPFGSLPSPETRAPQSNKAQAAPLSPGRDGSLSYKYSVTLPPGRAGFAPEIAFNYSSSAPLRGGLAAGWSFDLPNISRDLSRDQPVYTANLRGASLRLTPSPLDVTAAGGVAYRPLRDDFTRFEASFAGDFLSSWKARTPEGKTLTFAPAPYSVLDYPSVWTVSQETDEHGNRIDYTWTSQFVGDRKDFMPQEILYGANTDAGIDHFAKVSFTYAPVETCPGSSMPIGASIEHRNDTHRIHGARRLTQVTVSVRDTPNSAYREVRKINLSYDAQAMSCASTASPLRYLTQIDETVTSPTGVVSQVPPVTFNYGATKPTWSATNNIPYPAYPETGDSNGSLTRVMDMNGDGLPDYVKMLTQAKCTLEIHPGVYGGGFSANATMMTLPSAHWKDASGPYAHEFCRMEGQYADRLHECADGVVCSHTSARVSYTFVDWDADGKTDVIAHAWGTPGDIGDDFPQIFPTVIYSDNNPNGPSTGDKCADNASIDGAGGCSCDAGYQLSFDGCEPVCWGHTTLLGCEEDPGPGGPGGGGGGVGNPNPLPFPDEPFIAPLPEPGSFGWTFRWRVFLQSENAFNFAGSIDQAPVALDFGSGVSSAVDSFGHPTVPAFVDINGDGLTDVVTTPLLPLEAALDAHGNSMVGASRPVDTSKVPGLGQELIVHLHNSLDAASPIGLMPEASWPMSQYPQGSAQNAQYTVPGVGWPDGYPDHVDSTTSLAFSDVDADGLPDLIVNDTAGQLGVVWNRGGQVGYGFTPFYAAGGSWGAATLQLPFTKKTADFWGGGYEYQDGLRGTVTMPMDVDADGLPDHLALGAKYGDVRLNPASVRNGFLNLGEGPALPASLPAQWDAAKSIMVAKDGYWYRTSAVMDVNGDGVPDLVTWSKNNFASGTGWVGDNTLSKYNATVRTEPAGTALRLLTSISNGRGATTTVTYTPTTNPVAVNQNGVPMPQIQWVVRTIQDAPGAGQPALTRTFSYAEPARVIDDPLDKVPRFRGFEKITTDEGSTLRTVSHVSIWTRVLPTEEERWIAPSPGAALVLEKDTTHSYAALPVLGLPGGYVYETDTAAHLCNAGQSPADCKAVSTNALLTHHDVQAVMVNSLPSAYVSSADTEVAGAVTRVRSRTYATWTAPTDYQIVLATEQLTNLAGDIYGKTTYEDFDARHRPKKTRIYLTVGSDAVTTRTYDLAGNVTSVKRPNQAAVVNGPVTATTYDAFAMYPVQTVNELGHTQLLGTDIGTGVLVKRDGPDYRMVDAPSCATPPCAQVKSYSPERFVIDGSGRVIEHDVANDPTGGAQGYTLFAVETAAFNDAAIPNHRVTTTRLGYTGTALRTSDETLDGKGRVVSVVESGGAGTTPVTTAYHYDARGALAAIDQPDPRNDAQMVTFSFTRDGDGRVVTFTRPDGSSTVASYGALDSTVEEHSPQGDVAQKTKRVNDLFGRLASVVEYDNPTPGANATTTYTYDIADNTTRIVDPDGTITDATYDRGSRRTSVTRGTRRWTYGYDADGNLVQRRSPLPTPNADPALYTWTTAYDKLDRVTLHTPAAGSLSAADRAALAVVPTQYVYDANPNGVGKLAQAKWSYGAKTFYYDVHNRPTVQSWSINLPATPTFGIQQSVTRSFTPSGQLLAEKWEDGSQWGVQYDFKDRPTKVQWLDQSLATPAWKNVAVYTRSAAGAPRARSSDYGSSRAWQYDAMGRVTNDTITAGAVTKSNRTYVYDGLGDLIGVAGQTAGLNASAGYTYDSRGRLTVASGPAAYSGQFKYSAGGNVTRATISGNDDTPARDAKYAYGATDKQAVDALTDFASNAPIASFGYDMSGNTVSRTTASGTDLLIWDGDDVLRKVTRPTGTERYVYDHEGNRILAIRPDGVTFWNDATETHYSANGVVQSRWLTLSAGEVVGRVENKTSLEVQYADTLGSVILTMSPLGATTGSFTYGAFGEVVASTGEESHPVEFQGKTTDLLTGFHYHGARYYDPLTLRWISADPLYRAIPDNAKKQPQRGNWYAFNLNNAVHYTDPDGRDPLKELQQRVAERFQAEAQRSINQAVLGPQAAQAYVRSAAFAQAQSLAEGSKEGAHKVAMDAAKRATGTDAKADAAIIEGEQHLAAGLDAVAKGTAKAMDEARFWSEYDGSTLQWLANDDSFDVRKGFQSSADVDREQQARLNKQTQKQAAKTTNQIAPELRKRVHCEVDRGVVRCKLE